MAVCVCVCACLGLISHDALQFRENLHVPVELFQPFCADYFSGGRVSTGVDVSSHLGRK